MRRPAKYWRELGAVALMRMGRTDYAEIAMLVDLEPADVERIDEASETRLRTWAIYGTPLGEFAELTRPVRCNGCGMLIDKAPCLRCQIERQAKVVA
jgi:hypothetical protein